MRGLDGRDDDRYRELFLDAMFVALSGRMLARRGLRRRRPSAVLREIWEDHFVLEPAAAQPG